VQGVAHSDSLQLLTPQYVARIGSASILPLDGLACVACCVRPEGTASQPPIEGLYQAGMPLLQQCLFQFHELLKQEHPRLGLHLEQEGVVPSMYCTHWFNTLFAYSLPFEQLLRVWDVFLLEGMKVGLVLPQMLVKLLALCPVCFAQLHAVQLPAGKHSPNHKGSLGLRCTSCYCTSVSWSCSLAIKIFHLACHQLAVKSSSIFVQEASSN
jgi:hypothetical protein